MDIRGDADLRNARAELRPSVVDLLRQLRGGGLPNPMLAVEQLSLLLLVRHRGGEDWSKLAKSRGALRFALLRDEIFPRLRPRTRLGGDALEEAMGDAAFAFPGHELLDLATARLRALPDREWLCADVLDVALDEMSATSTVGSPRTPGGVSECMVALVAPRVEDSVLDPAAGAGDRLLSVLRCLAREREHRSAAVKRTRVMGVELDATMVRLGVLSLVFHGVEGPQLRVGNALASPPNDGMPFDVVLCQPPFGNRIDPTMLVPELRELRNVRSELLFAELALNLLGTHGRAAIVLPVGVTTGTASAAVRLRRRLLERLRAVIALPQGTFQPHTNSETVLVALGASTDQVVFIDARGVERGLSAQSTELLRRGPELVEGLLDDGLPAAQLSSELQERVFLIDKSTIRERGFSLWPPAYRPVPETGEAPDSPLALFGEIERVEREIGQQLLELGQLLAARAADDG